MRRMQPMVRRQVTASQPIVVGDTRITLLSRTLIVAGPAGGVVWQRPWVAHIEADGRARRVAIRDLTRLIELGLLGLGLALVAVAIAIRRSNCSRLGVVDADSGPSVRAPPRSSASHSRSLNRYRRKERVA